MHIFAMSFEGAEIGEEDFAMPAPAFLPLIAPAVFIKNRSLQSGEDLDFLAVRGQRHDRLFDLRGLADYHAATSVLAGCV